MARIAKAVARTTPLKGGTDLFSDLPEAAPRRPAGKSARAVARVRTGESGYTAHDIEVLEGLEPVRRRPGM